MKINMKLILVVMSACLISAQSNADFPKNSTWTLANDTANDAKIRCVISAPGTRYPVTIDKDLPPLSGVERILDQRYGDGLGFPENGTPISCASQWADFNVTLNFRTKNWGSQIDIDLKGSRITVTETEVWPYSRNPKKTAYFCDAQTQEGTKDNCVFAPNEL